MTITAINFRDVFRNAQPPPLYHTPYDPPNRAKKRLWTWTSSVAVPQASALPAASSSLNPRCLRNRVPYSERRGDRAHGARCAATQLTHAQRPPAEAACGELEDARKNTRSRPQMGNKGSYIVSLGRDAVRLGGVAEELGVKVYPGSASSQLLIPDSLDAQGLPVPSVGGVLITHDSGLTRPRTKAPRFEAGVAFRALVTLLAEGAHGSLAKNAIWDIWAEGEEGGAGKVVHTSACPSRAKHTAVAENTPWQTGLVSIGLVVGLDYKNPYLGLYREFLRVSYGARALTQGGSRGCRVQTFRGARCAAEMVGVAEIKEMHNAMWVHGFLKIDAVVLFIMAKGNNGGLSGCCAQTGMLAGEAAFAALHRSARFVSMTFTFQPYSTSGIISLSAYTSAFSPTWTHGSFTPYRTCALSLIHEFRYDVGWAGTMDVDIINTYILPPLSSPHLNSRSSVSNEKLIAAYRTTSILPDTLSNLTMAACKPIDYPAFEPPLNTDLMGSVTLMGYAGATYAPFSLLAGSLNNPETTPRASSVTFGSCTQLRYDQFAADEKTPTKRQQDLHIVLMSGVSQEMRQSICKCERKVNQIWNLIESFQRHHRGRTSAGVFGGHPGDPLDYSFVDACVPLTLCFSTQGD
ncbi:hypothetical protein C8R45DRAFT_941248 [Mycena sanguinolenta]|nr:hypothetical protein C8R45DRAFT_941248 [Mycena sanguinolenta]